MRISIFVLLCICCSSVAAAGVVKRRLTQQHTAAAANDTTAATTPNQSAGCTPPRTMEDTMKPFCFIPDTVSPPAKEILSMLAAGATGLGRGDLLTNKTALAESRMILQQLTKNSSEAAAAALLGEMRNDTLAGVPVVFGTPKNTTLGKPGESRLLVYLHGGGYFSGSCHFQWSTAAPTAAKAGLPILCIEYRLAPEHPFPAGLNDVVTVYKELLKQGYKADHLVLLGDSAGGGMVPAVAIQLQRESLPLPAALGMFSPWAELQAKLDTSVTLLAIDPLLTSSASGETATALLYINGGREQLTDPLVSPLRADYASLFAGGKLPPTLIQVGLRELLLSDAVLLYHKLKAAAPAPGHVSISPYDAMWHVFQMTYGMPEAEAAAKEMADFYVASLDGSVC